jgi:hypothetical protein
VLRGVIVDTDKRDILERRIQSLESDCLTAFRSAFLEVKDRVVSTGGVGDEQLSTMLNDAAETAYRQGIERIASLIHAVENGSEGLLLLQEKAAGLADKITENRVHTRTGGAALRQSTHEVEQEALAQLRSRFSEIDGTVVEAFRIDGIVALRPNITDKIVAAMAITTPTDDHPFRTAEGSLSAALTQLIASETVRQLPIDQRLVIEDVVAAMRCEIEGSFSSADRIARWGVRLTRLLHEFGVASAATALTARLMA